MGLVALLYAFIDTTSYQVERNLSALTLAVSDLRANMSLTKVDQILFLRRNRQLIPGLGEVLTKWDILKNKRDAKAAESVAAKAAVAANPATVSLL